MARHVTARELKAMLDDATMPGGRELALIDLREEHPYSESHLLHARSLPLSRLELRLAALVPRRATRIVLCDGGEGLAERAAMLLARFGYSDVALLAGGIEAWDKAGYTLFSGVNVPSKAFGEFVEHDSATPSIAPEELEALMRAHADMVVLDSRPFDEYSRVSIPTGIDVPGAELVLRARDLAPDPATLVVVNCAGRTRSIIGAQSLIDAGLPNRVVALRNGTMGWTLAGFTPDHGSTRRAPAPSEQALAWAKEAAARIAQRCRIQRIDRATLDAWQEEPGRTTYLFDVRDPGEYEAGHVPGAVSAPGGQLVQGTDQFVGTLGARLVLIDPLEVRALMTASWLKRMGWDDVFVLPEEGRETGRPGPFVLGLDDEPVPAIDAAWLADLIAGGDVRVVDLSTSRAYREGHIEGAWFAIRARLDVALPRVPAGGTLVLTSEDGVLARLAVGEAQALGRDPVLHLEGGNRAWAASGGALVAGAGAMADEPLDLWLKAYERASGVREAMVDYLQWEVELINRIAEDGTCHFSPLPPA
ncbi:MAG TPA: rhodanese-like domain-containing protein [Stellaceae bacterium]|nr:rhodanese-like domain-containing protein [Stellaceae bacterium]